MGLVQIRFPQSTTEEFSVTPRRTDNLADHVKRADGLPEDSELGANWDQGLRVYRAYLQLEDDTGTRYSLEAVEFITNTWTGVDNWYRLIPRQTEQGVTYVTN